MTKNQLEYWKKIYLLYGREFTHREWVDDLYDDSYTEDEHGYPLWMPEWFDVIRDSRQRAYKFTDKALELFGK